MTFGTFTVQGITGKPEIIVNEKDNKHYNTNMETNRKRKPIYE